MTKKIISTEDKDLFRQAVGEVRAVKSDKVQHKKTPLKPKPATQTTDLNDVWQQIAEDEIDPLSHEESVSYAAPGIQNNVLAKLKKGFFGIQAETDLHGLTAEAAKQQLASFLQASVSRGHRCVHVIHGKGYRSQDNQPILKNHLNRWLRQHKDVLAFCSAPPKHGGAGAVYVLLRKAAENTENFG